MPTVSSTDGSPTNTCWKRRSSAASFSMYLRYSSSVVAPTRRSSPRASIGLIMLPASIEPSPVAPAPTMVCSSSMNVMICPALFLMSSRTALSRSSNSPRYLLPATIEPRSSETTVLSRRLSGTSPATMRWARPSTIAVLPTPGSPISTGLFLVRRDSTCTTRRISVSRPMTGSSLPSLARAVRSVEYFSSAWYVPSGSGLVTRALPRTLTNASRSACGDAPWPVSSLAVSESPVARPTIRCSVETYSSSISVARCWAAVIAARAWRDSCGCDAAPLALGSRSRSRCASARISRGFDADGLEKGRGNAVVLGQQCHQQVGGRDLRVTCGGGRLQRRGQRRLGLGRRVERVHETVPFLGTRAWAKCLSQCSTSSILSLFRSTLVDSIGAAQPRCPQ